MLFVLIFFRHQMFLYNVNCVHHLDQISIVEGVLDPFCLWKTQMLKSYETFLLIKNPKLKAQAFAVPQSKRKTISCLVDISFSVVFINLVWICFVQLVQVVWNHGTIPHQPLWSNVVLIPKGRGDYRVIRLLKPIWKVLKQSWIIGLIKLSCTTASTAVEQTVGRGPR